MSPLDVLLPAGRIWPRLVGIVIVAVLVVAPNTGASIIRQLAREEEQQITSRLKHSIDPVLRHRRHSRDCRRHVHCQR